MRRRIIQLEEPKQVSISCYGDRIRFFHKFEFSFENLLCEMQGEWRKYQWWQFDGVEWWITVFYVLWQFKRVSWKLVDFVMTMEHATSEIGIRKDRNMGWGICYLQMAPAMVYNSILRFFINILIMIFFFFFFRFFWRWILCQWRL